jgi:hypothetical protein
MQVTKQATNKEDSDEIRNKFGISSDEIRTKCAENNEADCTKS